MSFWRHIFGWRYDHGVMDQPPRPVVVKPSEPPLTDPVTGLPIPFTREEALRHIIDPMWDVPLKPYRITK